MVGSINPVREITDLIHHAGAWAIVDGVSFCPHGMPDIPSLGADIYMFSLYKVYGPHLGAMYINRDLNTELPYQGHFFNAGPSGRTVYTSRAGPCADRLSQWRDGLHGNGLPSTTRAEVLQRQTNRLSAVSDLFRDSETALLQPLLDFLSESSQGAFDR